MEWVTLIDTVVVAIATVVVAIATVVYVSLTSRLLKETKRSIDETNRPEVVIFLKFEEEHTELASRALGPCFCKLSLCIMNVGTRAARKIRFEGDFTFKPAFGDPLNRIKSFKNGIDLLIPGQVVTHTVSYTDNFADIFNDEYYRNRSSKVEIHVKYQSVAKNSVAKNNVAKKDSDDDFTDDFTLDFLERNTLKLITENR